MKVHFIVLVVSAGGSRTLMPTRAMRSSPIVGTISSLLSQYELSARKYGSWTLDLEATCRLRSLTAGSHLCFGKRWTWRKLDLGSRCDRLLRDIFIERILCNHGDRLAFDRDEFGVNEKRVESFISTLATGLSNGWGRGVKLCFPIWLGSATTQ